MQFVIALCQVVDIERVYTLRQINPVLVDAFDAVGEADLSALKISKVERYRLTVPEPAGMSMRSVRLSTMLRLSPYRKAVTLGICPEKTDGQVRVKKGLCK